MSQSMKNHIAKFLNISVDNMKDNQLESMLKNKLGANSYADALEVPIFFNAYKTTVLSEFKKLKPRGPRGEEWFNGKNINDIVSSYNEKYSPVGGCSGVTFFDCSCKKYKLDTSLKKHKGYDYVCRDFETYPQSLTYFNIDRELELYNCFSCVINTDYSHGRGIHWVCIFIDATKPIITLEYFDSAGEPILPEVKSFFKRIDKTCSRECEIISISNSQQEDNHSCGAYATYYIKARLEGVPYQYFIDFKIKDKNMHKFRKAIFRE